MKTKKARRVCWCSSYEGVGLDPNGELYLSDGISVDPYFYYDKNGKEITRERYWKIKNKTVVITPDGEELILGD